MRKFKLKDIDPEDIEDFLLEVGNSFDIKFEERELIHIETFGQLCDHIANKIQLEDSNDCTSQQAFYKLRNAITSTTELNKKTITPQLLLADFLPRKNRQLIIKNIEQYLGYQLKILRPPHWIAVSLWIILLVSFVALFIQWKIGLLGLIFSIFGLWVAYRMGNELDLKTVGQVADKMTRYNYLKSRRNPNTFNKSEIEKVLTDWFSSEFGIDKGELGRDAKFA